MIITWLAGVAAATAALVLLRSEAATGPAGVDAPTPGGNALAGGFAWTALLALAIAGLVTQGLMAPLVLAAAGVLVFRRSPAAPRLMPYYFLKLPLAAGALIAAIAAWLGVLTLFGGTSHV